MKKTNRSGVVSTPFYAILSNINPNFFHWLVAGQGSFVLHFLGQWGGRFFPPTTQGIRLSLLLALLVIQWTLASEQVQAQTCDCKEYIYLNEPDLPGILKFEVNSSSVGLTEVAGANGLPHWYPGTGSSELPNPHGLGTDLNGRLYIGSEGENSLIRQLTCDGVITPVSGTTINDSGTHQNIFSIGNILYTNRHGGPAAYNSCTGAFVGQMCLDGASSNLWGLSYNETTQMVYATQRFGSQKVWAFTRAQLEAGIASASCLNPIITLGPNAVVNPGENFLPNIPNSEVFGITSDNAGNMYVVVLVDRLGSATSYLYKYNAAGNFVSSVAFGLVGRAAIGIVWSETTNRLYTSHITDNPAVNCISAYDASTLAYLGTAAPNPGVAANNSAKAIAILKECCPVNLQSTFTKNVCGGIGQKFYLNEEAFNTCDGVVCGSSWTPTSLNGMTFDACDNSVEITGASGCSTFTLDIGAVSSTGCGAQSSTFTICNNPPPVISASASACAGSGYTLSGQVTFAAAPATSGTMTVSVAGGGSQVFNAPFTSPIAYSIAGLNGDGSSQTVSVNFSDGSGCMASANYVAPLCCAITLTPTVSGCYQRGGESRATVNVEVAWANPPAGGSIIVTGPAGSVPATRTVQIGTIPVSYTGPDGYTFTTTQLIVSPQVVAFEIPANGSAGLTVAAEFDNDAACNTTSAAFNAPAACPPLECVPGELGGTVFYDNNANGTRENGESTGLAGVTVRVFDCTGNVVGTTTTDIQGKYTLNIPMAAYPVRVEFEGIPSFAGQGTLAGVDGRTTVQFVSAPDCSIDLGVLNPGDYCQTNPLMIVPCFVTGDPLPPGAETGMGDALIHFEYGLSGVKDPSAITVLAKASEVGSLWGIAYDKFRNRVFSSAVLRRHSGLGPLGLGGIYVTDMNTNTTTDYVDVAAAPLNINVGAVPSNVARNLGTTFITPSNDADAFALVGKVGIGDIDISEDGNFLFFTNLHDRRLYQLDISGASPTLVGSYPIPGACEGGTSRPFGLKVYQGKVYVGVVCDALASDNKSNLRASVQEFTPGANTFTEVFNFPLTYPKGPVFLSTAAANAPLLEITGWFPWTDDFDDLNPNSFSTNTNSFRILHPQPILSDIEFDVDGSMVLGFADRTGMQTGYQQYPPVGTELFSSFSGGDILRAAKAGNVFLLENNGTVNGITGAGPDNNQGPGFGEFYNDDWLSTNDRLNHSEQAFGALALLPGSGQVVMTSMDPLNRTAGGTVNTGGIKYLSNSTGQAPSGAAAGFILYDSNTEAGTVAKSTGLGDLELGCSQPTYLQIGNYVWLDTDQDGVQDACEDVLPGVLVSLYDKTTNTFLASTTTSASGEYYFTGLGAPNENWVATAGYDSLQANTQYTIVFGYNGADMNSQFSTTTGRLTLGGMPFVPTVANTGEGSNADLNDSDATTMAVAGQPYTNYPMIMLTTGGEGSVNHTYDAGFAPSLPVSLGDTTWVDANRNGLQDPLEVLLADVTVRVFNAADDTPVTVGNDGLPYTNSTTTNAMGFYEFTNLPPGDYYVVFDLSTVPGSGFLAFTSSNAGDDADDSDADPLTGRSSNTGFLAAGTRFPDLDAGIICNVSVEAGTGQTICSTANVDLTALGASIMPTGVAGFAGTWTSSGTGTFSDGAGRFGVATFYTPSAADILVGQVILTLTTDNPMDFGSLLCDPASDDVMIVILKVNCGSFPWSGN